MRMNTTTIDNSITNNNNNNNSNEKNDNGVGKTLSSSSSSWKSSIKVSQDLRELTRPSVIGVEQKDNHASGIQSDSDNSSCPKQVHDSNGIENSSNNKKRKSNNSLATREKVTVILRPGVFAGMNSFQGSGPDLQKARTDLKIGRKDVELKSKALPSQGTFSWTSSLSTNDPMARKESGSKNYSQCYSKEYPAKRDHLGYQLEEKDKNDESSNVYFNHHLNQNRGDQSYEQPRFFRANQKENEEDITTQTYVSNSNDSSNISFNEADKNTSTSDIPIYPSSKCRLSKSSFSIPSSMEDFELMDAQQLKFSKPLLYWAPDINELQALQCGDEIMLSVSVNDLSRRFQVKVTNVLNFPDEIQGMVNECGLFSILGIRKGTILNFEARHIFAVHERYRDALFDRFVSMEMAKKEGEKKDEALPSPPAVSCKPQQQPKQQQ